MLEDIKHEQKYIADLMDEIERLGCVKPEVDNFYETFNGSYVFIHRAIHDKPSKHLSQLLEGTELSKLFKGEDGDSRFVAVVLQGGHSLNGMKGAEKGEDYVVSDKGEYRVDSKELKERPKCIGMSLKREVGHIRYLDTMQTSTSETD